MSNTLVFNSSNVVGSNNNTFQYNFIQGAFQVEDCEIAIGSLTLPYSWYNVTTYYNNQTFTIVFPYASTSYTMNIVLPAGFYLISDINNYVQLQCINLGLYLMYQGQNIYYFDIVPNTTYYSVNIVLSLIPSTLPSLYTQPTSGYWSATSGNGLPTTSSTPTFSLAASGSIAPIIGYAPSVVLGPSTTVSLSFNSTGTPLGSNVNSILMRCNLVSNDIATPSDILDGIPINSTFGANITYNPSFEKWVKMKNGRYSNMTITFSDQNLNTLYAQDSNMLLTLLIRKTPK
jgi:hypothetical protein